MGIELGQHLKFVQEHTDSVRLYGGGYYFDGPSTESVAGWRSRLAADISSDISVGARFQRDDERGSQGFLEATVRFPFGHKQSYRREGLRARLDDAPERDIDIITGEAVTSAVSAPTLIPVLNATTGNPQEVLHVDNTAAGGGDGTFETPFNTLVSAEGAASAHTIIYVRAGDGGSTNQDQGITLNQTGQQLIGAGTDFVHSGAILIAATNAPVITNINANSDGITVNADNIAVAGVTVDGATRDGILIEADGGATSVQNVTITNVTARNNRMGIYIHGTNGGNVSAKVENSVTTANSQHGMAVYDDTNGTFTVDLGGGSMGSTGNNVLTGNTLEDLAVEYDGGTLSAQNNWWGQASGADTDDPSIGIDPQIYYGAPINDGLIGNWTFDNEWTTNTIAYDRSGQGNNGTLQGGLSLADQVVGQNRQALDFDGSDDFVEITNIINPTEITVLSTARSNTPTWNDNGWLVSNRTAGNNGGFILHPDVGSRSVSGYVYTNSYRSATYTPIDIQVNSSYAYSYDGNTINIFYNGANVGSNSTPNGPIIYNGAIGSTSIGRDEVHTRYGAGVIDDTRIYNRALSASEISELYRMNTSSTVDTSGFLTAAP